MTAHDIEQEIATVAEADEVALPVWSPLSGGYLSGKYTAGSGGTETGRRARLNFPPIDPLKADPIVSELRKIAMELHSMPAQVALARVLGRSEATSVIIGVRTEAQFEDNLNAQRLVFSGTQRERLDSVSQTETPYPHGLQQFHDKDRVDLMEFAMSNDSSGNPHELSSVGSRSHQVYPTLDERQLAILERYGERRKLKANDILYSEGDRHISMFVILSGTVESTRASVLGRSPCRASQKTNRARNSGHYSILPLALI